MLGIFDNSLRLANFLFLVIVLGLTGSLIHGQHGSSSRVNFAIFAAVFGLVFDSFYGIAANFISYLAYPAFSLVLDFLNFVFTFASATALAVAVKPHSCTNHDFIDNNHVAQGSVDRCRKAQASTAFLYLATFCFIAKIILGGLGAVGGGVFGGRKPSTGVPAVV